MREDEFRQFYEEHAKRLWAYLTRMSGSASLADEVTQEAFVRMWALESFDSMDPKHRQHYLYKVAGNLVRREARNRETHELTDSPAAEGLHEEALDVRGAFQQLKPSERDLLWLAYVEEFSHREIGALAGYRENSVRPLLHRAKQKLLTLLGGQRGDR